jgi:ferric-dicitrate binding protein FerR (iron transport regulator)
MHFIVQTSDGIEINLHLGPARVVDTLVALLSPGQTISFEAFTTPDLSADTFIAKTVSWESGFIEFRDDALRPFWAK